MASSGTIYGNFSGISADKDRPYIYWSVVQQDINSNWSDIKAELWFEKVNSSYWGYNLTGNATGNIKIDNGYSTSNITFDLRNVTKEKVREWTYRVYHNSDGTKTCYIGADGDTKISWGTYNFGQTVQLPTIPREAYITNNVDFYIEDDIPMQFWNDGNLYIQTHLVVDNTTIAVQNCGQVTSATFVLSSSHDDQLYQKCPNAVAIASSIVVRTFSDSGYTNQVGSDKWKNLTVYVKQDINKPTFTNYSLQNINETIQVADKYGNVVATSDTNTLTGTNTRFIKNFNKIRATIAVADKMIPKNYATGNKYRLTQGILQIEANYSDTSDVTLDLDDVTDNNFVITAYDSRSLATSVSKTMSGGMADYYGVDIYNITVKRDNNFDRKAKLSFLGKFFNKYFGGGTQGVQNTITVEYRYKSTSDTWNTQAWNSLTVNINTDGTFSFDNYIDGDLGVNGFNRDKSFDIEIRVYDKLSVTIEEINLTKGIPLVDFTQNGIAILNRYNTTKGGELQVLGEDIIDIGRRGWYRINLNKHTFTYNSDISHSSGGLFVKYLIDVDDAYLYDVGDIIKIKHNNSLKFFTVSKSDRSNNQIELLSMYTGVQSTSLYTLDSVNSIEEVRVAKVVNPNNYVARASLRPGNTILALQLDGSHLNAGNYAWDSIWWNVGWRSYNPFRMFNPSINKARFYMPYDGKAKISVTLRFSDRSGGDTQGLRLLRNGSADDGQIFPAKDGANRSSCSYNGVLEFTKTDFFEVQAIIDNGGNAIGYNWASLSLEVLYAGEDHSDFDN